MWSKIYLLYRVMTKDNIALAALLQTKEACWEGGVPPDHKVFELFVAKFKRSQFLFCSKTTFGLI